MTITLSTWIFIANEASSQSGYFHGNDTIINFENCNENKVPGGFFQTATGTDQLLNWIIANDKGNKVVAQAAKNKGDFYNLLILKSPGYCNLQMTVKIKSIAGEEDMGGGLVGRFMDNKNYYILRCNPLENNFRLYCVKNGNRKELKSVDCSVKPGEWFTLSAEMKGNRISCYLNGRKLIETTDDTFSKLGLTGFWTKADAQSYFDDLAIKPLN